MTAEQAAPHNVLAFADKLADRAVWLSIGNDDGRVNTGDCITVARSLVAQSRRRHPDQKTVPVELVVGPSEGHRAIEDAYSLAARFVAKHVPRTTTKVKQPGVALPKEPVDFHVKLEVVKQELSPGFCWFHPRVAAVPGMGKAIWESIEADCKQDGVTHATADYGPRLEELERCAYLRPTIVHCTSPEAAIAKKEFMYPFSTVVQCPEDQFLRRIGPTLVCSAITNNEKLIGALSDDIHVDRLNIGAIPTIKLDWLQPHEGSIVEFLFRARAYQVTEERMATA